MKVLTQAKRKRLTVTEDTPKFFRSEFCVTDNNFMALFGDKTVESYILHKKIDQWVIFSLTEENLDIKINRNKTLEPLEQESGYLFNPVGLAEKDVIGWLLRQYPHCVFHPVTEWFGKAVNTLVCVLEQAHGKPVAVVKTL